tara:strand:+ start:124 stop:1644 length:1521 start_codon:yes stop_codon:yes gene_type:complete
MYFKRPSFKRGGSTGIAQLTPRVKAQGGYFGQTPIYPIPLNQIRASAAMGMGSGIVPMMKSFPMDAQVMGASSTIVPTKNKKEIPAMQGLDYGVGGDMINVDTAFTPEEIFAAMYERVTTKAKEGRYLNKEERKFANDNDIKMYNELQGGDTQIALEEIIDKNKNKTGAEARIKMTDTPNYEAVDFTSIAEDVIPNKKEDDTPKKELSFEDTYEAEKKKIERLIGEDDNKGMLAIALSDAIGTPGTIADKAAVLNKSLLGIMVGKKKDKKDIAKLAYTATKEIEKAKLAAGKEGFSERQLKDLKRLQRIVNDTTGSYSAAEKKAAQAEINITKQAIDVIGSKKGTEGLTTADLKVLGNIDALVKEIKRHEGKNEDKYRAALAKFARAKAALQGMSQFNSAIAIAEAEIGGTLFKKDGGRIKKQLGGSAMEVSETVGQGETPTAQVQQLSFSELRNRLPKEITDDVIRLLANSNEALQDFAYIRTQGDVSKFNTKYGVTLVLPAQTA